MININLMKGLPMENTTAWAAGLKDRAESRCELAQATAEAVLYLFEGLPFHLLPDGAVEVQAGLGEALERYRQARDPQR